MRWMYGALAALCLGAILGVAGPATPAYACRCLPADEYEPAESTDLIVQAVVTDIEIPEVIETSGDTVWVHLTVERVDQGEAAERLTLGTALSEASCGYTFEVGHRYLIVVHNGRTGLCSGNQHLGAAPAALVESQPLDHETRNAGAVVVFAGLAVVGLALTGGLGFLAWRRVTRRRATVDPT